MRFLVRSSAVCLMLIGLVRCASAGAGSPPVMAPALPQQPEAQPSIAEVLEREYEALYEYDQLVDVSILASEPPNTVATGFVWESGSRLYLDQNPCSPNKQLRQFQQPYTKTAMPQEPIVCARRTFPRHQVIQH